MSDTKKTWRFKARLYLAEAFGGKCTICGYDKTIAALDYHHLDPKEKDKVLAIAMKNGHAWSKIVVEARKCTLVCCRCHRELHAGVAVLPENCARFNEAYADIINMPVKNYDNCPVCGSKKNERIKFCSRKCASEQTKRFVVSKEELAALVDEMPYTAVGRKFGVSSNAVRQRCKVLGIDLGHRRGYWQKRRAVTV